MSRTLAQQVHEASRARASAYARADVTPPAPPTAISASDRLRVLERNLSALRARGQDFTGYIDAWRTHDAKRVWLRSPGANIDRMRDDGGTVVWEQRGDQIAPARRLARKLAGSRARPVVIEGADPPWVLQEICAATPPDPDGYQPRLTLVVADVMEFLDGLAWVDMTDVLTSERLHVFVGPDATRRLASDLRQRLDTQIAGPVVPVARRRASPLAEDVLRQAEADQKLEYQRLAVAIDARYRQRDMRWWSKRYTGVAGVSTASGEPLRILVPTSRFSTFIQHAARDLVSTLGSAGHHAELLIEPDDSSRLSSLAYVRAIDRLDPDLIILINYMRAHMAQVVPSNIPFVTWVQDAMLHQYEPGVGERLGELDFLVGNVTEAMFSEFAYPRARTLRMPVVASAHTFHARPVEASARGQYKCDIAWVTHHSETPEAMHDRLVREGGPQIAPLLQALRPHIKRIALDAFTGTGASTERSLTEATAEAVRHAALTDEHAVTRLLHGYARPLADRILRHQTIHWAADIAERRGWRLHIYGRGWETHPRLGAYAAGEVSHDEALRACYQCASAHLHVTIGNIVHQRIMECALAGGLPLCRLNDDSINLLRRELTAAAFRNEPIATDGHALTFATEGDPACRCIAAALRAAGALVEPHIVVHRDRLEAWRAMTIDRERRADWLLGDLSQTTFTTPEGLERLIERAITDDDWRRDTSTKIADRVRTHLTDDVLARRVIALVRDGLTG